MEFIKSATEPNDYPPAKRKEIVVAGRSNCGKSSLLNAISRSKIAKVSSTPGKTRTLNFFRTSRNFDLVDVPGYGYAARSAKERDSWGKMIESYFSCRGNIAGLLLLVDIRREWRKDEDEIVLFANSLEIPVAIVLTKADKLARMHQQKACKGIKKILGTDLIFPVSSTKSTGIKELLSFCQKEWVDVE